MIKKIIAIVMFVLMAFCFASCGDDATNETVQDDENIEVALIIDGDISDGGFNQVTWECIDSFCSGNDVSCGYYTPEGTDDKDIKATVKNAIDKGGKLLIFAGSTFDTAVYDLQKEYEDVYFYLIDAVPFDGKGGYKLADNSIGVLFAEEQAGYLAGYAAVMDGYTDLGFMGGEELPSVKRYGYGFLQGISAAAAEQGTNKDINVKYKYTGTFIASDDIYKEAAEWYGDGTEVIFSCGGGIVKSVINAAESKGGKVIGVDVDQSGLSGTVITSAKKGMDSALEDVLKEYNRGNFIGNNVFNYTASNGGVGLEMDHAKFKRFNQSQYEAIFNEIKNGSISIKKDTEVDKLTDLVQENIKIDKL